MYKISREPVNGFAPNSQRCVWSLAQTSWNVKVKGQGQQIQKRHFPPFWRPACGFCLVKHLWPLVCWYVSVNICRHNNYIITFRVSCTRREVHIGHVRLCLCVCVSVPRRMSTVLHGPGCNLGNGRGALYSWADLKSVHGFHCYGNTARTRNVSECLYSLCAWCCC